MCKYCEPDEAGNLANIEEDGNMLRTYLEDWEEDGWVLTTEIVTICNGSDCNGRNSTHVNNCPMCGRRLREEQERAMCYTGKCPYEYSGGEGAGECRLRDCDPRPDDAECVLIDRYVDEYERRHPIKTLIQRLRHKWHFSKLKWRKQDEIPFY